MSRRVYTADDVLGLARSGRTELVVAPGDLLTPLARDLAHDHGIKVVTGPEAPADPAAPARPAGPVPPLRHVAGVSTLDLDPFPFEIHRPEMDVRLRDVVTSADKMPIAAGVMSLREGAFPWTLEYDEVEYVIEGELHITTATQKVVGRAGDVIAVPKGSSITFGTPSWAKFLYVTYPAEWGGA